MGWCSGWWRLGVVWGVVWGVWDDSFDLDGLEVWIC